MCMRRELTQKIANVFRGKLDFEQQTGESTIESENTVENEECSEQFRE